MRVVYFFPPTELQERARSSSFGLPVYFAETPPRFYSSSPAEYNNVKLSWISRSHTTILVVLSFFP